jgi:hypothetical protein
LKHCDIALSRPVGDLRREEWNREWNGFVDPKTGLPALQYQMKLVEDDTNIIS